MPDDRDDEKLPVTTELGDEGGSYGDATTQAETFTGELGNLRPDPKRVGPAGGEAAAAASQGEQVRSSDASVKHATESSESSKP